MKIQEFDIRVNYEGGQFSNLPTGEAQRLLKVSEAAGKYASLFGNLLDERNAKAGKSAGVEHGIGVEFPEISHVVKSTPTRMQALSPKTDLAGTISGLPQVASAGKGFTDLQLPDGSLVRRKGTRAWRNHNPGNIEFGKFAQKHGAIGTDGRFAVFPSYQSGRNAKTALLFQSSSYKDLSISQALNRYAPPNENDTNAYVGAVAGAIGVDASTALSSLSANQRKTMLNAMEKVEGFSQGTETRLSGQMQSVPSADSEVRRVQPTIQGSFGALELKPGNSVYAQNFNDAAIRAYEYRADSSLRAQMDILSDQFSGDPAGLNEALGAMQAGILDAVPNEMKPDIALKFERLAGVKQRQAYRELASNNQQEYEAAFFENMSSRRTGLHQVASQAGLDPQADLWVAQELEGAVSMIEGSHLSPLEKAKQISRLEQDVTEARIIGAFENEPTAEGRKAFAARMQESWQSGSGIEGTLTPESYSRVNSHFGQQLNKDAAATKRQQTAVTKQVDRLVGRLKKGFAISSAERGELRTIVANSGNPALADAQEFMEGLADWQSANRQARPDQISAQIDAHREDMQTNGATERGIEALTVMEALEKNVSAGVEKDQLTYAHQAGIIELQPLDASSAEALAGSLQNRVMDAETVSDWYGTQPRYFTEDNKQVIKKKSDTDPTFLPKFALTIREAMGDATPAALAELSDDAPMLAHAAGLVMSNGQDRLLTEMSDAITLRNIEGYKPSLPKPAALAGASQETVAGALALLPKTMVAATETAKALFESRTYSRNTDIGNFGSANNEARGEWQKALNEALGATWQNGVQRGGIGIVNETETLLPTDMSADAVERILTEFSADDFGLLPPVVSSTGIPVRPHQMQEATLVAVNGGYRVALGDPASLSPRWLMTEDGYLQIQLKELSEHQQERRSRRNREWGNQFRSSNSRIGPNR